MNLSFFRDKRVFVTGHTGFKGSWLSHLLVSAGAEVTGYALPPNTEPALFDIIGLHKNMNSILGDIRDYDMLKETFDVTQPEIVLHLAAQPIVREGYADPRYTYETNVMGTVNLLECIRLSNCVKSFLNVTTDKVYENREWMWGYRENEPLNGYDPYSNSKSCSDILTQCYRRSFLEQTDIPASTARAGNVIGGGDFANDRIIPDCVRAALEDRKIVVRNPHSVRPYQHVLEPVCAYLEIARLQYEHPELADAYNVGPYESDCIATGELVDMFCTAWGGISWVNRHDGGPHEANFLKLDCSKITKTLGWRPKWHIGDAIAKTVEWVRAYQNGYDMGRFMNSQIADYVNQE